MKIRHSAEQIISKLRQADIELGKVRRCQKSGLLVGCNWRIDPWSPENNEARPH